MSALFTSSVGPHIERFLAHKRALGRAYYREEAFLREIDRFARCEQSEFLSERLVRAYLSSFGQRARPSRLTVIHQMARFLVFEEPRTFIPPSRFLGIHRERPVIRVLSRDEVRRFLDACDHLPPTSSFVRHVVHGMALRVLLLTGLRRGEVIHLKNQDVDLDQSVLHVRGKFGKMRIVPITPDLAQSLRAYRRRIKAELKHDAPTDAFFPGSDGRRPIACKSLYKTFRCVLRTGGIEHGGRGKGPRIHDLRHTFAVLRLLSWYESNADLGAKLPLLATYLGHVGMVTSQVYLHMTRDLVGEVIRREMDRFGDLITEVSP